MSGTVYFLSDNAGSIKIGHTRDLGRRIKELSVGGATTHVLLGRVNATLRHEKALHALLAEHRIRGEWLADNPAVRSVMERALVDGLSWLVLTSGRQNMLGPISESARTARAIAHQIARYCVLLSNEPGEHEKQRFIAISKRYGLRHGLLWQLTARPKVSIDADDYAALLKAGQRFFADLKRQIEADFSILDAAVSAQTKTSDLIAAQQRALADLVQQAKAFGIDTSASMPLLMDGVGQ